MFRYRFELATPHDDAELRAILAATQMPGRIAITFRREPSYFDADVVLGEFHQTIVGRDHANQRIMGFGSRAVRSCFINGEPATIGYLSSLRVRPQYRGLGLLGRGYECFRELHDDGRTSLYLTTIAEGNDAAVAVLTSGRAGLPIYHPAGTYCTLAIPLSRRSRRHGRNGRHASRRVEVRSATVADLTNVIEFLHRCGSARQFFPRYDVHDFFEPRGTFRDLQPHDLWLVFRNGRLVGTLAAWDQHRFRQTIVNGYSAGLRWMRPVWNGWARVRGSPRLPAPGEPFRHLVAALPVIEDDDPAVFAALMNALRDAHVGGPCAYLLLGLHETDPLLPTATAWRTSIYRTRLYHVGWGDDAEVRERLDRRPPYLELGCL
ncbi:MAG: hypothetical protein WD066_16195 [Planctomycetaceae bacterium]